MDVAIEEWAIVSHLEPTRWMVCRLYGLLIAGDETAANLANHRLFLDSFFVVFSPLFCRLQYSIFAVDQCFRIR